MSETNQSNQHQPEPVDVSKTSHTDSSVEPDNKPLTKRFSATHDLDEIHLAIEHQDALQEVQIAKSKRLKILLSVAGFAVLMGGISLVAQLIKNQETPSVSLTSNEEIPPISSTSNEPTATMAIESVSTVEPVFNQTKYVSADEANVRVAPTLKGEILATLTVNTEVRDSGVRQQADNITWANIQYVDGHAGWISDKYLSTQKSLVNKIHLSDKCIILSGDKICVGEVSSNEQLDKLRQNGVKLFIHNNIVSGISITGLLNPGEQKFTGKDEYGIGFDSDVSELMQVLEKYYNDGGDLSYISIQLSSKDLFNGASDMWRYAIEAEDRRCTSYVTRNDKVETIELSDSNCNFYAALQTEQNRQ